MAPFNRYPQFKLILKLQMKTKIRINMKQVFLVKKQKQISVSKANINNETHIVGSQKSVINREASIALTDWE